MGTWGAGNLDVDSAWDELSDRTAKLIASMMKRARRKASREADEYDYTTLFVEFEIVFALEARKLLCGSGFPTPEAVEELKADYLRDWDANVDKLEPTEEHKKNRRRRIVQTFNRFQRICKKHQENPRG